MHRKRVTCELHGNYFSSMTIKRVDVELSYNWVHRKFNQLETRCGREIQYPTEEGALGPPIEFGDQTCWRQDVIEKASTRQNGALGLPIEFGDQTSSETRCGRESQHPAGSWKETLRAIKLGVNMLQFCSVSNSLSHTTLSNKVRGTYFSKEQCLRSSLLLCRLYSCVVMILHASAYEYTKHMMVRFWSWCLGNESTP